jgi:S-adenosylmethionine:tRNA ribosyltransferase-isomerase
VVLSSKASKYDAAMLVSEFDFDLPDELIAQEPTPERGTSRMLVVNRRSGQVSHQRVVDLTDWLGSGDVLVVNDTRVFPARLLGQRVPSGGRVEVLLLERIDVDRWDALVHPGQKLKVGSRVLMQGTGPEGHAATIHGEIVGRGSFGRRTIRLWTDQADLDAAIDAVGHVPLPPYIHRPAAAIDRERYQTVYAMTRGSIAAPTAGLHFTPTLLDRLASSGVERVAITLHVGYGTFKPVRTDRVEQHQVDPERYAIAPAVAERLNAALDEGRRIVAVGTTTVRALESAGTTGRVQPGEALADLFIHPGPGGHQFHIVNGLLTNFHLPRSSLLMLACAFGGRDLILTAYHEAVATGYRFYSYGDAMLIL